jgi:hypothetical protein
VTEKPEQDDEFTTLDVSSGERRTFASSGLKRDADGNLTLEITEIADEK